MDKILTYVMVVLISIIATVMDLAVGTHITLKQLFSNFWFYLLFIIQSAMASLVFYGLSTTEKFNDNSILDAIIVGFLFPMLLRSQFAKSEKFTGLIDIYERVLTFVKDRIDEPTVKYRMKLTQIIISHCDLAHLREIVFNHIEARNLTDERKEFEQRNIENRLQEVGERHQAENEIEKQKKMVFISYIFKNIRANLEDFLLEFNLIRSL